MPAKSDPSTATVAAPTPIFDDAATRFEVVSLDHPFTLDGVRHDKVTVRRMTAGEVRNWTTKLQAGEPIKFPMFDVPDVVIDALDADDGERVDAAVERFLPRRFRAKTD